MAEFDDYFAKKRAQLGLERGDQLAEVQALLDAWYPGQVRARRLHQGVLRLVTPSAAVAGELRLRQIELMDHFPFPVLGVKRLQISIGTLA